MCVFRFLTFVAACEACAFVVNRCFRLAGWNLMRLIERHFDAWPKQITNNYSRDLIAKKRQKQQQQKPRTEHRDTGE